MKKTSLAFAMLLTGAAHGADQRHYALLSLAGDAVTTVTYVPGTGTRLNPNDKQMFALNNTMFDEAAIRAASTAVKQVRPDEAPLLMLSTDAELHQAQNAMFDDPAANQANRDYLKSLWKDKGVSHLILVTTYRADAELKYFQQSGGTGKIEGLGFYMDNKVHVVSMRDKNESTQGVLMPFAYVKLRLIDADTLAVVREVTQKQSQLVTYAQDADRDVRTWGALSAKQKMDYLEHLMRAAVTEGVPKLLAP